MTRLHITYVHLAHSRSSGRRAGRPQEILLSTDLPGGLGRGTATYHCVAMTRTTDAIGAYGERVAALALTGAGMVVLDRHWRCASGELDIVARDGNTIVFCEVKTRRGAGFGTPVEAVGYAKVRRLRALGSLWLATHSDI